MGVDSNRPSGFGAELDLLPVEPCRETAGEKFSPPDQEQRSAGSPGLPGQASRRAECPDEVQGIAAHVEHRPLRQCGIAVFLLPKPAGRHRESVSWCDHGTGQQLGAQACWDEDQTCEGRAATGGSGAGEGLPGGSLHTMAGTSATLAAPNALPAGGEAVGGDGGGGSGRGHALASVSLRSFPLPALPLAQLRNPRQICYLNSVAQALGWIAQLTDDPRRCAGEVHQALALTLRAGRPCLPQCMPWFGLLVGWEHLNRQHDAGVFMSHLLSSAPSSAFMGSWQARLIYPDLVTDTGPLHVPVPMTVQGPTLQDTVQAWHSLPYMH